MLVESLQTDRAAKILSTCKKSPQSVSQLVKKIAGSNEGLLDLLNELETGGLLTRRKENLRRGRPRYLMETTNLGEHFLQAYEKLMRLRLRSNLNDIKAAIHQANLAMLLEESGISPYTRFNEIVEVARNISNTAKNN